MRSLYWKMLVGAGIVLIAWFTLGHSVDTVKDSPPVDPQRTNPPPATNPPPSTPPGTTQPAPRPDGPDLRIAVLPFSNASPDPTLDSLGEGFSDLLVATLSGYQDITLVERNELEKVYRELALSHTGLPSERHLHKVGQFTGASLFVKGSYTYHAQKLTVNAHAYDIETTRLLTSTERSGELSDLAQIGEQIASDLVKGLSTEHHQFAEFQRDSTPHLTFHFMKGLGYYHTGLYEHATASFMQVLFLEPDNADARYWMGLSYLATNEVDHAQVEFEKFLTQFETHPRAQEVRKLMKESKQRLPKPL